MTEHLSRGIVDFGIAVGPARTDDYHAIKLPDTDRWGALVPADDDLAAAASLGPQDLIDRPYWRPEKILAQQRIWRLDGLRPHKARRARHVQPALHRLYWCVRTLARRSA